MWSPRSIVYPLSSVEAAPSAVRSVVRWAQRLGIPLHVTPWPGRLPRPESEVRAQIQALAACHATLDLRTDAYTRNAFPQTAWQAYVAQHDVDLVVLTPPDECAAGPLLSCAKVQPIVARTTAAILALPHAAATSFDRVLAPTDMTKEAVPTLHHAEAIADFCEAELHALHVLARRQYVALTRTDMLALDDAAGTPRVAKRRLRTWYHRHTHPAYSAHASTHIHVEQGDPVSAITRAVQAQQADLIVLAATHHPEHKPALSTLTENVLRRTTCAVLITRPATHSLVDTPTRTPSSQTVSS